MGVIVSASCDCGYETEVGVGGGMADRDTTCGAPASCGRCKAVVEVDVAGSTRKLTCPTCGTKVGMYGEISGDDDDPRRRNSAADWSLPDDRAYILSIGPHRCPKCNAKKLLFVPSGLFD